MLMLELSPMLASQAQVRIVGTDVSAAALRAAGRATYTGRTLESAPPMVQDRWFEPRPGGLGVKDAARDLVELRLHNLVTEPPPFAPGEVDLIICRNVTIYFNRATTGALVGSFHDVLAEGGYLLLGHSETLWQVSDAFALVPVGDAFVYRKSHDSRRGSPTQRRRSVPVRSTPPAMPKRAEPAVRAVLSPGARRASRAADVGGVALLATARGHLDGGDYASAAVAAEAAVRADPLLAPAYVVLGRARSTLGEDAAAVDPLRKAVYLDPTAGDAHFLLAGALSRLGQHGGAAVLVPGRSRVPAAPGRRHPPRPARRPRPGRAGRPVRDAGRERGRPRRRRCAPRRSGGGVVSGWVTFVMGSREMAGALDEVREVVRATGLEELSGTRAPVTSLLELRGTPVPGRRPALRRGPGRRRRHPGAHDAAGSPRPRGGPGVVGARAGRPGGAGPGRALPAGPAGVRRGGPS